MAITFWPLPGTVLMCDFTSNTEPEMVKVRRVVVVSAGGARPVMLVVPLSTTPPWESRPVHVKLTGRYAFLAPNVGRSAISLRTSRGTGSTGCVPEEAIFPVRVRGSPRAISARFAAAFSSRSVSAGSCRISVDLDSVWEIA